MLIHKTVRLHSIQSQFRHGAALYRAFCGGVGSGKTWAGAYDLIRKAKRNRTYMIGSPTAVMLGDTTLPTFRAIAEELCIWDPATVRLTPYPTVVLTIGATVRFRTAQDPEKMRGPNLSGIWLDEASLMPRLAYDIGIGRLRECGEQGWLTATFTPKGPTHWTHEAFATDKPDTKLFRAHTGKNPFLPREFKEKLRQQYGETNFARQELEGEFVQLDGAEFPAEWFVGEDLWFEHWPDDLVLKVVALDPSKGSDGRGKDYQAHVLIGLRVEKEHFVFYVDADLQREGVVPMCERTVRLTRSFGRTGRMVDSVVCEENGTMGFMSPSLETAGVRAGYLMPWVLNIHTIGKEVRIRTQIAPPLSTRRMRFRRTPGARMLVGQLQSFPLDEFDDGPDALATGLEQMGKLMLFRV